MFRKIVRLLLSKKKFVRQPKPSKVEKLARTKSEKKKDIDASIS